MLTEYRIGINLIFSRYWFVIRSVESKVKKHQKWIHYTYQNSDFSLKSLSS
jgi:hypothetical protein